MNIFDQNRIEERKMIVSNYLFKNERDDTICAFLQLAKIRRH